MNFDKLRWNSIKDKLEKVTITKNILTNKNQWHRATAWLSDEIYKYYTKLNKGFFASQIAYVAKIGKFDNNIRKIAIMDLYGKNLRYITNGSNLVLSPKISNDGNKIIYFS